MRTATGLHVAPSSSTRFDARRARCREGKCGGSCMQSSGPRYTNRMRQPTGGRGRVVVQNPKVTQTSGCICGGYMERKSRALPREISLSVWNSGSDRGCGSSHKTSPGQLKGHALSMERTSCHARSCALQTREAERSTMGKEKSAESISCRRTATKEEHKEMNRNRVFDA